MQPDDDFAQGKTRLRGLCREMLTRCRETGLDDLFPLSLEADSALVWLKGGSHVRPPIEFVTCARDADYDHVEGYGRVRRSKPGESADNQRTGPGEIPRQRIPPTVACDHPEYVYVFLVRVRDPYGPPCDYLLSAIAEQGEGPWTKAVDFDQTDAREAAQQSLRRWVRYIGNVLVPADIASVASGYQDREPFPSPRSDPPRSGDEPSPSQTNVPPSGDWSEPMTMPEFARRVTGRLDARRRDAEVIAQQYGGWRHVQKGLYTFRLDGMPKNLRKKAESPT